VPLSEHVAAYFRPCAGGEMGALPAVLGLLVLCTVFTILRPAFLTAGNFANLLPQGAAVTVIAMGLIFVLLLGEIDLSAGYTSGVCASILAIALLDWGSRGTPPSRRARRGTVIGSRWARWWPRSAYRPLWSLSPRSWRSREWCC
jgi:ribose/xylose/arabinose/galactoside ABC-type transport system permease subunit